MLGSPWPPMLCSPGKGQGKLKPFYFPAKTWLILTPFLSLGAAILPSLDLEVIPINIYENFMIKRGISPFIFQTCLNAHCPAPKPCATEQKLLPCTEVPRDAHPKTRVSMWGQAHPPGPNCRALAQHFFLSLPLRITTKSPPSPCSFFKGKVLLIAYFQIRNRYQAFAWSHRLHWWLNPAQKPGSVSPSPNAVS